MNEQELRREQAVAAVMARITAAPPVHAAPTTPAIDILAWARPALAAALVIIAVSAALTRSTAAPETIAEAVGAPRSPAELLRAGDASVAEWLDPDGGL